MYAALGRKGPDSVSTVELLLKNGADPGAQNVYGETALFKTAFHGQYNVVSDESAEIVQLLLSSMTQEDLQLEDEEGMTAAFEAAR